MKMERSWSFAERALELALRHERDAKSKGYHWSLGQRDYWLDIAAKMEKGLPIHPQAFACLVVAVEGWN